MKTKIIAGIVVIVLIIAVAFFVATMPQPTPSPAETAAISSVVGEQYSNLIQEQLNNLSIDQPEFINQTQDSMASDYSQFYFS